VIGLVAGPAGAIAGAASGPLITRAVRSAFSALAKQFSDRQSKRAFDAFEIAIRGIGVRLKAGESLRADLFAVEREDEWPEAAGLLERTLRQAAEAAQEQKVRLLGKFWENLVFESGVSADEAHYLLGLAERLTYRQLILLELFGSGVIDEQEAALLDAKREEGEWSRSELTVAEMDELGALGLLGLAQSDGTVGHPQATLGGGSFRTMSPRADSAHARRRAPPPPAWTIGSRSRRGRRAAQ
jgi:hypothetical protein